MASDGAGVSPHRFEERGDLRGPECPPLARGLRPEPAAHSDPRCRGRSQAGARAPPARGRGRIDSQGRRGEARLSHEHGIDILVDLKGHTKSARLEICALRPAPVQATYLGFPGGAGFGFGSVQFVIFQLPSGCRQAVP